MTVRRTGIRVAVVAGPDPGHAFPAIALCLAFLAAGDHPILFTGVRWNEAARDVGIDVRELSGLTPRDADDDGDAGERIHARAAYMSSLLIDELDACAVDMVVSDVLTASGGMAAERLGLPWVELLPHPLYAASKSLPPIGSGLAPGVGIGGYARDHVMRALTARSIRQGRRQRGAARESVGLPGRDPGPAATLVATIPALEVPRADWPVGARLVGPLLWEPTRAVLTPPAGTGPLVVIAPSTAFTGADGMLDVAISGLAGAGVRVVASMIDSPPVGLPPWVVAGLGRQDELLREARVVICGAGHGMLAKTLCAGVPVVAIPGGGDQWELANRAARQGSAVVVRPLSSDAIRRAVATVLTDRSFADAAARAARGAADVKDPVAVCRSVLASNLDRRSNLGRRR